jgi:voltage-gated potassium channel Kch
MSPAAGANYRSVWAMQKHYPHVKTYVRAHDVNHGINLEKAGATVVVPEILEPSLQLAASVLSEFELPYDEVTNVLDQFRKKHLSELQVLAASTGETGEQRCRAEARAPRGTRGGCHMAGRHMAEGA